MRIQAQKSTRGTAVMMPSRRQVAQLQVGRCMPTAAKQVQPSVTQPASPSRNCGTDWSEPSVSSMRRSLKSPSCVTMMPYSAQDTAIDVHENSV